MADAAARRHARAGHGALLLHRPFLANDCLCVSLKRLAHLFADLVGKAFGVAVQIAQIAGFLLHDRLRRREGSPGGDGDEGHQHGIDHADDLDREAREIVMGPAYPGIDEGVEYNQSQAGERGRAPHQDVAPKPGRVIVDPVDDHAVPPETVDSLPKASAIGRVDFIPREPRRIEAVRPPSFYLSSAVSDGRWRLCRRYPTLITQFF